MCGAIGEAAFTHDCALQSFKELLDSMQEWLELNRCFHTGQRTIVDRTAPGQQKANTRYGSQTVRNPKPEQDQCCKHTDNKREATRHGGKEGVGSRKSGGGAVAARTKQ